MKKILFFTILLVIFSNTKLSAQNTPEELMDKFFVLFETNPSLAFDYVFSTNKMIDLNQPEIQNLKDSFEKSRKVLGNYYGYETAKKLVAGTVYAKYYYVLKYERQPLKLEAIMYKPNNTWKILSVMCKESLDDCFEEIDK